MNLLSSVLILHPFSMYLCDGCVSFSPFGVLSIKAARQMRASVTSPDTDSEPLREHRPPFMFSCPRVQTRAEAREVPLGCATIPFGVHIPRSREPRLIVHPLPFTPPVTLPGCPFCFHLARSWRGWLLAGDQMEYILLRSSQDSETKDVLSHYSKAPSFMLDQPFPIL